MHGGMCLMKIIGQRFELNDNYISVIAELMDPKLKFKINQKNVLSAGRNAV